MKKTNIPEEIVFIWIGYNGHHVDKICPVLGGNLGKKYKIRSMFCNGQNIEEVKQMCLDLRKDKSRKFQFIALDVGFCKRNTLMLSVKGGIKPSTGVKKQKIHLGDVGYIINIDHVYDHVKGRTPQDCLLENYTDRKVKKKVNKLISRMYSKLDNLLQRLEEVSE